MQPKQHRPGAIPPRRHPGAGDFCLTDVSLSRRRPYDRRSGVSLTRQRLRLICNRFCSPGVVELTYAATVALAAKLSSANWPALRGEEFLTGVLAVFDVPARGQRHSGAPGKWLGSGDARVMAHAGPGEVVVSDTVEDLGVGDRLRRPRNPKAQRCTRRPATVVRPELEKAGSLADLGGSGPPISKFRAGAPRARRSEPPGGARMNRLCRWTRQCWSGA